MKQKKYRHKFALLATAILASVPQIARAQHVDFVKSQSAYADPNLNNIRGQILGLYDRGEIDCTRRHGGFRLPQDPPADLSVSLEISPVCKAEIREQWKTEIAAEGKNPSTLKTKPSHFPQP